MTAAVSPERFRHVLGHVPTGVAVIAAMTPDGPAGLAVGTFMSVSLEPPLVGFLVAETSTTWPRPEPIGRFAVSVLGEDNVDASRTFSVSGGDKFASVSWHASELGQPVLDDSLVLVAAARSVPLGLVRRVLQQCGRRASAWLGETA